MSAVAVRERHQASADLLLAGLAALIEISAQELAALVAFMSATGSPWGG